MAIEGPNIISLMKNYLQNALNEQLDTLIVHYLNAFSLHQRIVNATDQFEKNHDLSTNTKIALRDLVSAAFHYLENFNTAKLLSAIEKSLVKLQSQQGYIINFSRRAIASHDIYQQLVPIKEELNKSVTLDTLLDSFVILGDETAVLSTPAQTSSPTPTSIVVTPPPPPPAPTFARKEKEVPLQKAAKERAPIPVKEVNQEVLIKRLLVIEQQLKSAQDQPLSSELQTNDTPKLALVLKRELTTSALEAARRRNLQRLKDIRSDPSLSTQLNSKSKGLIFLSMLQGEISERKEKVLKSTAAKQKVATCSPTLDEIGIEEGFENLRVSNRKKF